MQVDGINLLVVLLLLLVVQALTGRLQRELDHGFKFGVLATFLVVRLVGLESELVEVLAIVALLQQFLQIVTDRWILLRHILLLSDLFIDLFGAYILHLIVDKLLLWRLQKSQIVT